MPVTWPGVRSKVVEKFGKIASCEDETIEVKIVGRLFDNLVMLINSTINRWKCSSAW